MRTQRNQIGVADASVLSHLCMRTVRLQIKAEMKRNKEEARGNGNKVLRSERDRGAAFQLFVVIDTCQSSLFNNY
jgi:hypothetical protein